MAEETVERAATEIEADLQGCSMDNGRPVVGEVLPELNFLSFIAAQAPLSTRVTMLSRRQMHDIHQVRLQLETLAAELVAAQRQPDLQICWCEVLRMEEAAKDGSALDFYRADLAFHRALWKASRNTSLSSCLEKLVPKLTVFSMIQQVHPLPEELAKTAALHRQLLQDIVAGDTEAAAKWMTESLHGEQRSCA